MTLREAKNAIAHLNLLFKIYEIAAPMKVADVKLFCSDH